MLDHEFARLESVCRAAGPGTSSTEAWIALVGVADAWSEYVMVRGILKPRCGPRPVASSSGADRRRHRGRGVRPAPGDTAELVVFCRRTSRRTQSRSPRRAIRATHIEQPLLGTCGYMCECRWHK